MLYFRKCLFALVTPWGRLSPVPFAAMAFLLISAHCLIQVHITEMGEDLPAYNAWSMSLFVVMWFGFCITSRRFHDSGQTAFWLVPLLVITFASYLAVFDNLHFATSVFEEDRDLLRWSERARFGLQIAGMVAMIAALVRPGDSGDNAFGHEFHVPEHAVPHAKAARSAAHTPPSPSARKIAAATHHAAASVEKPAAAPKIHHAELVPTGPRGRITPSDTLRHRGEGFGRR